MSAVDELRNKIKFTKIPANPGDDGESFIAFLRWAHGNSEGAQDAWRRFRLEFTEDVFSNVSLADSKFIDWLIVNLWGETEHQKDDIK